jgi:hypothetical protein
MHRKDNMQTPMKIPWCLGSETHLTRFFPAEKLRCVLNSRNVPFRLFGLIATSPAPYSKFKNQINITQRRYRLFFNLTFTHFENGYCNLHTLLCSITRLNLNECVTPEKQFYRQWFWCSQCCYRCSFVLGVWVFKQRTAERRDECGSSHDRKSLWM